MRQFLDSVIQEREYIRRRGSRAQDSDPDISNVFVHSNNLGLDAPRREVSGGEFISPSTQFSTGEIFSSPTPPPLHLKGLMPVG